MRKTLSLLALIAVPALAPVAACGGIVRPSAVADAAPEDAASADAALSPDANAEDGAPPPDANAEDGAPDGGGADAGPDAVRR